MLTTHVLAVLFSLTTVFAADKDALAWMRGKKKILNARRVQFFHVLTWSGLIVLSVTGAILSYPMLRYLLGQPLFIMKLLFVAILFVNAILIGRFSHIATMTVSLKTATMTMAAALRRCKHSKLKRRRHNRRRAHKPQAHLPWRKSPRTILR